MSYQIPTHLKPLYPKLPYHNLEHTDSFDWATCPSLEAFWAAVFHDIVYDPMASNNEELSYAEFLDAYRRCHIHTTCNKEQVKKLILSTKDHVKYFDATDPDMVWLHKNDLACFRLGSDIAANELKIFKEYQFVNDLKLYKNKRLDLLKYYLNHPLVSTTQIHSIIEYLKAWQPKYGIFCGSFNPFHKGHYDIIQQAEKVFDKVIIAQGQNEDKDASEFSLDKINVLKYHDKRTYNNSLFSFLDYQKQILGNVTLIRGLRNYHDLHDESSIFNFGKDMTDVPFTYFISKSENLHISSGAIRKLQMLGKDVSSYLL